MCNRYRLSAKQAAVMRAAGFDPPYPEEGNHPVPHEIFPTGKKTARHGLVVRRSAQGNRPLEPVAMEWGFPTQVPSKRDPAVKLDKYVTNARNLASSMWRPSIASADRRCLVPFTHFAEPHPEGGMSDDGKPRQMWFSIPGEPIAFFAGLWRPTGRGDAYAFVTTAPNAIVSPWHPKAMPAILHPRDFTTWLDGSQDEALALVRPYDGPMIEQVETPGDELVG